MNFYPDKLRSCCVIAGLLLASCEPSPEAAVPEFPKIDINAIASHLQGVRDERAATLTRAVDDLGVAVGTLVSDPSESSLHNAREQWRVSHARLLAYRFFIDDPELLGTLDQWPIQPGFLDSVDGYPESGITHDPTLELTIQSLRDQHGITDPEEACLGLHPLEFLLFERTFEDFEPGSEANGRRRTLIELVSKVLADDVNQLVRRPLRLAVDSQYLSNADAFSALVDSLHTQTQSLLAEATLFPDTHTRFSESQQVALFEQFSTLETISGTGSPTNLAMSEVAGQVATDYATTLQMTLGTLAGTNLNEEEIAKLPLLASVLEHQLVEVRRALIRYYPSRPILP